MRSSLQYSETFSSSLVVAPSGGPVPEDALRPPEGATRDEQSTVQAVSSALDYRSDSLIRHTSSVGHPFLLTSITLQSTFDMLTPVSPVNRPPNTTDTQRCPRSLHVPDIGPGPGLRATCPRRSRSAAPPEGRVCGRAWTETRHTGRRHTVREVPDGRGLQLLWCRPLPDPAAGTGERSGLGLDEL